MIQLESELRACKGEQHIIVVIVLIHASRVLVPPCVRLHWPSVTMYPILLLEREMMVEIESLVSTIDGNWWRFVQDLCQDFKLDDSSGDNAEGNTRADCSDCCDTRLTTLRRGSILAVFTSER